MLGDSQSYCRIFFDFYGLPEAFPGKNALPNNININDKANAVNIVLVNKLKAQLGDALRRFIPFVQMYDFEALLFSDTKAFAKGIDKPKLEASFQQIADQLSTPKHINNSQQTSLSKRVLQKGLAKEYWRLLTAMKSL